MAEPCRVRGHVIIIIQTLLLPVTCIITYVIARSLGHVEERFPYISYTGTFSPESCIFGILLAFYAFGTSLCVYVLWKIVHDRPEATRCTSVTNHVSLVLGVIASLGILIVATFQITNVKIVHYVGAGLAFGVGSIYMETMACVLIRESTTNGLGKWLCIVRLCVAILALCTTIVCGVTGAIAGSKTKVPDDGKWAPWMKGYKFHLTSTSSEWACAGLVTVYFLSLFSKFKNFRVGTPYVGASRSSSTPDVAAPSLQDPTSPPPYHSVSPPPPEPISPQPHEPETADHKGLVVNMAS